MRPLEQQTVLVTGSTAGLGQAVASELAARAVTVLVHGRSSDRVQSAIAEISRRQEAKVRA